MHTKSALIEKCTADIPLPDLRSAISLMIVSVNDDETAGTRPVWDCHIPLAEKAHLDRQQAAGTTVDAN